MCPTSLWSNVTNIVIIVPDITLWGNVTNIVIIVPDITLWGNVTNIVITVPDITLWGSFQVISSHRYYGGTRMNIWRMKIVDSIKKFFFPKYWSLRINATCICCSLGAVSSLFAHMLPMVVWAIIICHLWWCFSLLLWNQTLFIEWYSATFYGCLTYFIVSCICFIMSLFLLYLSGWKKEYFYTKMEMPSSTLSVAIGDWEYKDIFLGKHSIQK